MTDFKDERSEPQSGWDARSKRIRLDVQVIFSSLLNGGTNLLILALIAFKNPKYSPFRGWGSGAK